MNLEFHQLDLRYEMLRRRAPERERRLLASIAQNGQQTPIVVVDGDGALVVVIDGYKRVRALRQLRHDTIAAMRWELAESDALLLERVMRRAESDGALEQAWLLRELFGRFGLTHRELGRRFDKSESWVSRRLALVEELPEEIQASVREGAIVAHAAMKFLVPMARANRADTLRLAAAFSGSARRPTSRQIGSLYAAWTTGNAKTRELLLADPWLFLRAQQEARDAGNVEKSPAQQLLSDVGAVGGISRRVSARLRQGIARGFLAPEREEARRCLSQSKADVDALIALGEKELSDA